MGKLKLPKLKRVPGLYIYCNCCHKFYSDDSKVPEKCIALKYKAKVHVPGKKHECRTKILAAKTFKDAKIEMSKYIVEVIASEYKRKKGSRTAIKIVLNKEKGVVQKMMLSQAMAKYMAFLYNEGVPLHKQKTRTLKYLKGVKAFLLNYTEVLEKNGLDASKVEFDQVDDTIVGYLHKFALEDKHWSGKSYNNFMACLRIFTGYIIKTDFPHFTNPFTGISKMHSESDLRYLEEKEFSEMLTKISYENGWYVQGKAHGKRNHYEPWLSNAFKLALFTGVRSEEYIKLKWNEIRTDNTGEITHFEINHRKLTKANNHKFVGNTFEIKKIVITSELYTLLLEMGLEKYRNTDCYIIAPEDERDRGSTLPLNMSKAFTHYYSLLGNGLVKNIKHLRKTYITSAFDQYGDNATILSSHKELSTIKRHYLAKEMLMKSKKDFKVFKDDVTQNDDKKETNNK